MILRVARHCNDLPATVAFYRALGLEETGRFESHAGYDGVFLGLPGLPWHLELTASGHPATHEPDEDDLLVFYLESREAFEALDQQLAHLPRLQPRNPYWERDAFTLQDPEGFRVVITLTRAARGAE